MCAGHNEKKSRVPVHCAEIERDIPRILYPPTFSCIPIFHRDTADDQKNEKSSPRRLESSYSIARYESHWETISVLEKNEPENEID